MGDNFHGLTPDSTDEAIEQDEMLVKLNLITITSSKNLNTMSDLITVNGAVNNTQSAQLAMTATSTLRTYAEASRGLITTNTSNLNNLDTPLFTDCIKFTINGSYAYTSGGGNSGSAQSTTLALTTTPRRFILVSTDTYSSNITLSDNNTTFRPNESGTYLSIISAEFYDNSADTKLVQLELIEKMGGSESSRQIIRNNFTGSSTSFEYGRLNNTAIVTLNSSKDYWYKAIGSANGGIINAFSTSTAFTLIKINKAF